MSKKTYLRRCLTAAVSLICVGAVVAATPAHAGRATLVARAAPQAATAFDVYFPPQNLAALNALTSEQVDPGSPHYQQWLTPQQFKARFGAAPAAVASVEAALRKAGFTVTGHSALGMHVQGAVGDVERTFGVEISHAKFADGTQALVAPRPLIMPAALAAAGAHVPQFVDIAPHQRHSRLLRPAPGTARQPPNFASPVGPYLPPDLRQAYDFPSAQKLNGSGMTVGILMSGDFDASDMAKFWSDTEVSSLAPSLTPKVSTVQVAGGAAFDEQNSGETHLDIQQSGGMALGVSIVLYNIADLSDGQILAGLTEILERNKAAVVNMSFGAPEADFPALNQTWLLQTEHSLFLEGNALGITFVASSGDNGGDPDALQCSGATCVTKSTVTPSTPASDPNVTAVGGTNLVTKFTSDSNGSAYVRENANDDKLSSGRGPHWGSGGGISSVFAKPSYQTLVKTPSSKFRTVPDLALHMGGCQEGFTGFGTCPADRSSDYEAIGGEEVQVIGTSASAPDITGLFILAAKLTKTHRLGNMNPAIYALAKLQAAHKVSAFRHIAIPGTNGPFKTSPSVPYDPVIGNGTVLARAFLGVTNLPSAGTPATASNP